jgi:hypothetical protein
VARRLESTPAHHHNRLALSPPVGPRRGRTHVQKSWKRGAATALFVVAVAAAGAAVPIVAHAGTTRPACTPHGSAAGRTLDNESLNVATATLKASGKSEADILRTLETDWCVHHIGTAPVNPGGNQVKPAGGTRPGADVDDILWGTGVFQSDNDPTTYYARISYQWIDHDYASDAPWDTSCYWSSAIGGTDGFALRLTGGEYQIIKASGLFMGDWNLDQYDGDYGVSSVSNTSNPNQYGVGYVVQDNVKKVFSVDPGVCDNHFDLDRYFGQIVVTFRRLNGGCGNTQVFGDYIHTWESTALTGIGAGKSDFSLSWDNKGHDFNSGAIGETGVTC